MSKYASKVAKRYGATPIDINSAIDIYLSELSKNGDRNIRSRVVIDVAGDVAKEIANNSYSSIRICLTDDTAELIAELNKLVNANSHPRIVVLNIAYGVTMQLRIIKQSFPVISDNLQAMTFYVYGSKHCSRPISKSFLKDRSIITSIH